MKKLVFLIISVALTINLYAQMPEGMSYQAVIRDQNNNLAANDSIGIQLSILHKTANGAAVFIERHFLRTNANGLVSIEIGSGRLFSGNIASIDWSDGPYFIKTETDLNGGAIFTVSGTSQLLSVPYALHAKTVEVDNVDDADADPLNEIQTLSIDGSTLSLSKNGGSVNLSVSAGVGDDWGTQTVATDATLTGNGTVNNPLGIEHGEILPDWGNIQNMPVGFSDNSDDVEDDDADPTNELQTISLNGSQLTLSNNGGTVNLPTSGEGIADNLGNHTATQNLQMDGYWLSNNGENKGLLVDFDGNAHYSNNLYLNSGRRIGIGVESPLSAIDIYQGSSSYQRFLTSASGVGSSDGFLVGIQSENNTAWLWNYEAGGIGIGTGNNLSMAIESDGDVGIGTNSPTEKLSVNGIVQSQQGGFKFPDGTVQMTAATGSAGSSLWKTNGSDIYYTDGKVGIDVATPKSKLSVGAQGTSSAAIYGSSDLKSGIGVYGEATGTGSIYQMVENYGGYFLSAGNGGAGVYGEGYNGVLGIGNKYSGVLGFTEANKGAAVRGNATGTDDTNYGGHFTASGITGIGVYGNASSEADAINYGGYFEANGKDGIGVYGYAANENTSRNYGGVFEASGGNGFGVQGKASGRYGVGVHGNASGENGTGLYGIAGGESGIGVQGHASGENGIGVYGNGANIGVKALSTNYFGITVDAEARGMSAIAVQGIASDSQTLLPTFGGYFKSNSKSGVGVYGEGDYLAGDFHGDVNVTGELNSDKITVKDLVLTTINALAKLFQIDHPLKPETHYLRHASIESNQFMNLYSGAAELDENGEAWVEFPDWFMALNEKFSYQLTCIGGFANVYIAEELEDNKFKIAGGNANMKVSWMVTGIRHDKYVLENPLEVEMEKPIEELTKK